MLIDLLEVYDPKTKTQHHEFEAYEMKIETFLNTKKIFNLLTVLLSTKI